MDLENQKEWFVYIKNQHEGPFSFANIEAQLLEGKITSQSYVWSEGMPDWKLIGDLAIFEPLLLKKSASLNEEVVSTSLPIKKRVSFFSWTVVFRFLSAITFLAILGSFSFIYYEKLNLFIGIDKRLEAIRLRLITLSEGMPSLRKWIPPLPKISDVSQDEYNELKLTARKEVDGKSGKYSFSIARSQESVLYPWFYLSSNAFDGTRVMVEMVGIVGTLLGQPNFYAAQEVVFKKKIAKTDPFTNEKGTVVPMGKYIVSVTSMDTQQSSYTVPFVFLKTPDQIPKIKNAFSFKVYFLGGVEDDTYLSQLKEYHETLREKAGLELSEIKQIIFTLESQWNSTRVHFQQNYNKRLDLKRKKAWVLFHDNWSTFLSQVDRGLASESFGKDRFYTTLYKATEDLSYSLKKIHQTQNEYFLNSKKHDFKTFEIQIGKENALFESTLAILKTKLHQAEAAPLTENGMPQREGL